MKHFTVNRALLIIMMAATALSTSAVAIIDKVDEVEEVVANVEEVVVVPTPTPAPSPTPDPLAPYINIDDVVVNKVSNIKPELQEPAEPAYTEEELEILAIIIYQEAGGDRCSDDTRLMVGSVFLNRVASDEFPNTFEEVATAKGQYGELYWTGIKWPKRAAYEGEARAVDRAYTLAKQLLTEGSILPDNVIWQAEFAQGDGTHTYQDGIYFCYSEVNE